MRVAIAFSAGLTFILASAHNGLGMEQFSVARLIEHTNRSPSLDLTSASGEIISFDLDHSFVMAPALADKFPRIRTWSGTSRQRPDMLVRCDQSLFGLHVQILSPAGTSYIDPPKNADPFAKGTHGASFRCLTAAEPLPGFDKPQKATNALQELRTFRLAVAAAGEYTEFHGGTIESAMAAIVTVVNRLNGVYERELGVRLVLVDNNELVIFTNRSIDPFTDNNPSGTTVEQAQTTFDLLIGTDNYDLGMVFNTGTYGLAYLAAVCDPQKKGSACMGLPQPVGEQFQTYVAHEMGHQFGANHTFNSPQGACGGSRNAVTAVEPGTGSTLMSYAGLACANDSLQPLMHDYFHAQSIAEIRTFLATTSCGTVTTTSNHVPSVTAEATYNIPKATPFRLAASASDPDGDTLLYCWEEMDTGPAASLSTPDNGLSPLMRSCLPSTNNTRTFPRVESILLGTDSLDERLPQTNRVMHFRLTVRDSQGLGSMNTVDTHVNVIDTAGPFRLLSHNSNSVVYGREVVRWDVAGTTNAPINASAVNILLSTNGGNTFTIILATNSPNDGSQVVTFPRLACLNARIKVEAIGSIFFDINDAPVSISPAPRIVETTLVAGGLRLNWTYHPSRQYRVEASINLTSNWQELVVPITVSDPFMEATVPLDALMCRYFRLREF